MACTTAIILAAGLISLAALPVPVRADRARATMHEDHAETANATGARGTDGVAREPRR